MMKSRKGEISIPMEIWFIILSLLPAKTLLRFRAVSKLFLALIDDPKFVSYHLSSFPANRHETQLFLLTRQKFQIHEIAKAGTLIDSFETGFPGSFPSVHGSINGVVLLSNIQIEWPTFPQDGLLQLWNPSTRKKRSIPLPSWFITDAFHSATLGYDHLRQDYKVLFLQCQDITDGPTDTQHGVYSVSTGSWKTLDVGEFGGSFRDLYSGVSFDGGVVWVQFDIVEEDTKFDLHRRLVLFDFGTERERNAALPFTSSPMSYDLFRIDGGHGIGLKADGHVWKLDMEKMTWTSLHKIGAKMMTLRILAARKENRKLLFWTRGNLNLCSYDTETMAIRTYEEFPEMEHQVGVHVESLIKF